MFIIGLFDSIRKSVSKSVKSSSKVIKTINTQIKIPMIKGFNANNSIFKGINTNLTSGILGSLQSNAITIKAVLDISKSFPNFAPIIKAIEGIKLDIPKGTPIDFTKLISAIKGIKLSVPELMLLDWSGLIEPIKELIGIGIKGVKDEGTRSVFEAIAEGYSTHGFSFMMSTPTTKDLTFERFIKWSNECWSAVFGLKPYNIWLGKENWVDEKKKGDYYDFMRIIAFSYIVFSVGTNAINSFFGRMIEQKINEYYAYSKLSIQEYIRLKRRDEITDEYSQEIGNFLGYDEQALKHMNKITEYYPSVSELTDFAVREAFDPVDKLFIHGKNAIPEPFMKYSDTLGIDMEWIQRFWHSHWRLLGAGQILEAFHRGFMNQTELLDYLRRLDYVEKDRQIIMDMSYNLLTRVDVRRIFEQGLISSMDLYKYYGKLGFTEQDQNLMTGLAKQMRFIDTNDLRKIYIERFENGLISENEIKKLLRNTGLDNDEINNYLELSDSQKELEFLIELKKRIETKFYDGDIDFEELVQQLRQLGVSNRELKRIEKNAVLFDFRKKKLPTLAEIKRYYKKEIIDLNKFVYYALRLGLEREHIFWILQDISG